MPIIRHALALSPPAQDGRGSAHTPGDLSLDKFAPVSISAGRLVTLSGVRGDDMSRLPPGDALPRFAPGDAPSRLPPGDASPQEISVTLKRGDDLARHAWGRKQSFALPSPP